MERRTLALLLDHPIGEYQDELRQAVERAARAHDVSVLTVIGRTLDAPRPGERTLNRIYDVVTRRRVDGVIIAGVIGTQCSEQRLLTLRDALSPLPQCSIGVRIPGVPALAVDDKAAMRLVVDHMVSHDCRRIAFLTGPNTSEEARRRYQGYLECLDDNRIPFDEALVADGNFDISEGKLAMEAILSRGARFDAVVASNDNMALGAGEVLLERGIRVPHQVLLGGFDDVPIARFTNPPLTTVRQPLQRMGERAVDSLLRQLSGERMPALEEIDSELVVRQSCGCAYRVLHRRKSVLPPLEGQTPLGTLRGRRERLRKILLESVRLPEQAIGGWVVRLFTALEDELGGRHGRFLVELEDVLEMAVRQHEAVDEFHIAISVLRAELRVAEHDKSEEQALEDLWHEAGILVGVAAARAEGRERMASEFAASVIRDTIGHLSTTLSRDALKAGLLDLLSAVKIPRSLVALCDESDDGRLRHFFGTRGDREAIPAERVFDAAEFFPPSFVAGAGPVALIAQPLTFETEYLGLLVLQSGATSLLYAILREQISASLKGAALHESVVLQTTLRERAERAQLEGELRIAERIQTAILPANVRVPWLEIGAKMLPASEVGGDYYDILPTEGACWVGIGDVTGHGLRAGLVMLMIQSMVSCLLERTPRADPTSIVNCLNAALYRNVRQRLEFDDHATFNLLRIDADGTLSWAGAHEDLLVVRASTGKCEAYPPAGTWIGARQDVTDATREQSLKLEPGDRLILYTDGLIEAMDARKRQFSLERVIALVEASAHATSETLCNELVEASRRFAVAQQDDITVVVLRYQPGSPRPTTAS